MLPKAACAGRLIGSCTPEQGTYNETMAHHVWYGVSVGRAATSASQVTIDITKITGNQFLASEVTDSRTLGIWLNGYVNGARGKTLIDPLSETLLRGPR
jgi:hypothetical protein